MLYEEYNFKSDDKKINGVLTLNIDKQRQYFRQDLIDLCPDCCEQFVKWLKNKEMRPQAIHHGVMGTTFEQA